jgi:phosphoribosylanthranilate isomerase
MANAVVNQITSQGSGTHYGAFMNVDEAYGHVEVFTSVYKKETYLIINGVEVHFVQFDRDSTQTSIEEFFEPYAGCKVVKIEEDGSFTISK